MTARTSAGHRRLLILTALGAVAALAVLGLLVALAVRTPAPPGPLLWADEFSGAAGSGPDRTRWNYDIGGDGWGNNELQRYTDSPANVSLSGDGHLMITIRQDTSGESCWYGTCRYTSARLSTLGTYGVRYGRLEARMKLPTGRGVWPAFWTAGENLATVGWPAAGEIDVMEHLGHEPRRIYGALHAPDRNPLFKQDLPLTSSFAAEFHTFAVEWRPESITWFLDGKAFHTEQLGTLGAPGAAFGLSHYLLLNVAVGGSWPGEPDADTTFPQTALIDYVRVYELA